MTPKDLRLRIAIEIEKGKVSVYVNNTDKVDVEMFDRDRGNTEAVPMSRYPNCVIKNGRKRRP
ncbi:MAG: hypothetical protein WD942_05620 [Dehalococcoidia bacterium]